MGKGQTQTFSVEVGDLVNKVAQRITIQQQLNAPSKLLNAHFEDIYSISSNCFKIYFLIHSMLMKGSTKQQQ